MVIIDEAPREVLQSDFVKACIEKEWDVQRVKIIVFKVIFLALYLILTNVYYTAFMFSKNPPNVGITQSENRWTTWTTCKS